MAAIKSQENSRLQVKSGVDLVPETDKAAEKAIIDLLKASHPVSYHSASHVGQVRSDPNIP